MIFRKLENSRAFLIALLIGTLLLLAFVALDLGGEMPERTELKGRSNSTDVAGLAKKMETTISPATLIGLRVATNGTGLFFTTYFQPPAPPKKSQAVTPPPAKKNQLTYQGVYESADGEKKAFIKVDDALVVGAAGAKVISDWTIADIALRTLTLKNSAAQTIILEFKVPKEIEVPNP